MKKYLLIGLLFFCTSTRSAEGLYCFNLKKVPLEIWGHILYYNQKANKAICLLNKYFSAHRDFFYENELKTHATYERDKDVILWDASKNEFNRQPWLILDEKIIEKLNHFYKQNKTHFFLKHVESDLRSDALNGCFNNRFNSENFPKMDNGMVKSLAQHYDENLVKYFLRYATMDDLNEKVIETQALPVIVKNYEQTINNKKCAIVEFSDNKNARRAIKIFVQQKEEKILFSDLKAMTEQNPSWFDVNSLERIIIGPMLENLEDFNVLDSVEKVKSCYPYRYSNIIIQNVTGNTYLHSVVCKEDSVIVHFLLKCGMDGNAIENCGCNPLYATCLLSDRLADVREILLKSDVDIHMKNRLGFTILHELCYHGYLELIKSLLKKYPMNLNAKNNDGDTPLHLAYKWGHFEVALFLVKQGADTSLTNKKNKSPFDLKPLDESPFYKVVGLQ